MPNVSELKKFHGLLVDRLQAEKLLASRLDIGEINKRWWTKKYQGEACFQLLAADTRERLVAIEPTSQDACGADEGPHGWVRWFEKWTKQPNDNFALVVGQWTLSWGRLWNDAKIQICRAEWDQTAILEGKQSTAGQPHWHVDPHLRLDTDLSTQPWHAAALEGIPTLSVRRRFLDFHRVHLAMGGWRNGANQRDAAPSGPLSSWQVPFSDDTRDLLVWAVDTLRYLKHQCEYIREYLDGDASASAS